MNSSTADIEKDLFISNKVDHFGGHDYYKIDDLLDEEHKMARDAVRDWVKKEVSPIIEGYAQAAKCPVHLFKGIQTVFRNIQDLFVLTLISLPPLRN
jgi:glutaryl-CoA dehydrogenase